ncbi:MAG: pyruvate formate lyase-activating protein [Planctomycetota bacterium]|nr:MAG: pyruvate formate lyase-activating protein [Planctomycetota bacterium]
MDLEELPLRMHSIQTLGCVDGPGLRMVVFCQGCPLNCSYCHNPDTRTGRGGQIFTRQALAERIQRSRPYFGRRGGVTFSGGEPLAQAVSLVPMLEDCQAAGIHTAIDTAGVVLSPPVRRIMELADMFILDIKHAHDEGFRQLTGGSLQRSLDFLDALVSLGKPVWIRQVMVPGITMIDEQVQALGDLLLAKGRQRIIERVELLPFHRMADHKYEEMGIPLPLPGVADADPIAVRELAKLLDARGLPVPQTGQPAASPPPPPAISQATSKV